MNGKEIKSKSILFLVSVAAFISNVLAQGEGILAQPIGGSLGNIGFLETINQFLLYEIVTWQQLAIFLAIWAGFYYASKPLLNEIFGVLLEAFPSDRRNLSRGNSQDVVNRSVKGLSVVSGFVAAQYVGWLIGGLALIVIAAGSILMVMIYYLVSMKRFAGAGFPGAGNFGNLMPGDDGARPDGGTTTTGGGGPTPGPDISDDVQEEIEDLEQDVEQISQQLNDIEGLEGKFEDAISEVKEEINQVENEASEIRSDITQLKQEVNNIDEFKQKIPEWVKQGKISQQEAEELKQVIDEVDKLEHLEEEIENHNEQIEQQEERIEQNEEEIARMEEKITGMEEKINNEFFNVLEDISNLAREQKIIRNEINQVKTQVSDHEVDINQMRDELNSLTQRVESLSSEVGKTSERANYIASEVEELQQILDSFMHDSGSKFGEIEERAEKLEERLEQVEKEERQGEQIEGDEEEKVKKLPDKLRNGIGEAVSMEETVLELEEKETQDEEQELELEEYIEKLEKKAAKGEVKVGEEISQEVARLLKAVEALQRAIEQDQQDIEAIGQEEGRKHRVEEENIREIWSQLKDIFIQVRNGNLEMSEKETIEISREYYQELEKLKNNTQDLEHSSELNEAQNFAKKIIRELEREVNVEGEGTEETRRLAIEAEEIAGSLPSGRQRTVFEEVERSFETAGMILNPNTNEPGVENWRVEQCEKWVWSQQEHFQELEELKRNNSNQEIVAEAEKLEEGLIDVINKICDLKGIDRGQFSFLS